VTLLGWQYVAHLVDELPMTDETRLRITAQVDQMQAAVRGTFDEHGLNLDDERIVLSVLVTLELVRSIACRGHDEGLMSDEEANGVFALCRTFGATLRPYVPEEVRHP
jgi:hypothetical protein